MYKLERYDQKYYFVSDKEELFNQFDNLIKNFKYRTVLYNLNYYFTVEFKFSSESGNFLIKEEKLDTRDNEGWIIYKRLYVNGLWKIYRNGYAENLDQLIKEYCQSRNIEQKINTSKSKRLNNGSKKENKQIYTYRHIKTNCKKEFEDSFYAKDYNVKIRAKRFHAVKLKHVYLYEDEYHRNNSSSSWKDQSKRKKQYKEPIL